VLVSAISQLSLIKSSCEAVTVAVKPFRGSVSSSTLNYSVVENVPDLVKISKLVAFIGVAWNINIYCLASFNLCNHHAILDVE
jgi:hypothetical protein